MRIVLLFLGIFARSHCLLFAEKVGWTLGRYTILCQTPRNDSIFPFDGFVLVPIRKGDVFSLIFS